MGQTVYLHVGAGRCGSSSIQRLATAKRSVLAERGILYPDPVEMGFPPALRRRRDNAWALYAQRKEGEASLQAVSRYLDATDAPRFLFSSEFLLNGSTRFLTALIEALGSNGREVVVVGYVRNQPEWLVSRYGQAVKSKRFAISLEEYLRRSLDSAEPDWLPKFKRLEEIVGRDHLRPRLFEPARLFGADVRSDLFALAGVDVEDLIEDEPKANSSASVEELEAARLANAATDASEFNPRRFLRHARQFVESQGWDLCRDIYRLVDPSLIRELRAQFAPLNERFRAEYFPELGAPLFAEVIPADYEPLPQSERVSARSIAMLASYHAAGVDGETRRRVRVPRRARPAEGRAQEPAADPQRVSICAIAKNEASYLEEWVAYHHLLGFGPIRIYSHEPDDESPEVLERLAEKGLVEWTPWSAPPDKKPQWLAYEDGLSSLGERSDWIAFIDLDEYVVIPNHETIQEFLADHPDFDAIAVNWKMFGSSGQVRRQPGLVIERFTRCARRSFRGNRAVKTLARTSVIETPRVHTCHFTEGTEYKTVSGEVLPPADSDPAYPAGESTAVTHDEIRIHHYFTRSREEWEEKAARGRGAKPADHPRKHRTWREFDAADRNEEIDTYLLGLAPKVKELIASLEPAPSRHPGENRAAQSGLLQS